MSFTNSATIREYVELTNEIINSNYMYEDFPNKIRDVVLYISKIIFKMNNMVYIDYFSIIKKHNISNELEINNDKNLFKQVYSNLSSILEDLVKFTIDIDDEVTNSEYVNNKMNNIIFRINLTFKLITDNAE